MAKFQICLEELEVDKLAEEEAATAKLPESEQTEIQEQKDEEKAAEDATTDTDNSIPNNGEGATDDNTTDQATVPSEDGVAEESPFEDLSLVEVSDSISEDEYNNNATQKAIDDVATIGKIKEQIETTLINENGLSPLGATMANLVIKQTADRLGADGCDNLVPAAESFSTMSGKYTKTQLALETISEFLIRIWESIKRAIASAIAWIKTFLRKMADSFKAKDKEVKDLIKLLNASPKADNLINGQIQPLEGLSVITRLRFHNRFDPIGAANALFDFNASFFLGTKSDLERDFQNISTTFRSVIYDKLTPPKDVKNVFKPPSKFRQDTIAGYLIPKEKRNLIVSFNYEHELPAGVIPIVYLPAPNLEAPAINEALRSSEFILGVDQTNYINVNATLLDKSSTQHYLQAIERVVDSGEKGLEILNEFIKKKEELEKEINSYIKAKKSEKVKDPVKAANLPSDTQFANSLNATLSMLDNVYLKGTNKVLRYLHLSLEACIVYGSVNVKSFY